MTRYFKPIEFPELDRLEKAPEPPKPPTIEVDITERLVIVREEIAKIQAGTSKLRRGAITFPKGQSPVLAALKTLENDPTNHAALWHFIGVAKQDLGLSVTRFLVDLFIDIDPNLERLK